MAFKTMFNPKAFSPQTVLSQDVGTSDTRIYVDDVSVFPATPTLATIGADSSTAETVKVTAIGSNFIDVERGYVGSAKAFTANTVIARNFSSADQQIIQDNLIHLNDVKLEEVATDDIVGNAVTNAKLAQVATSTIKGRRSSGTGAVEDLTATQVREIINVSDGADKTSSVIEAAANVTIADNDAIVIIDDSASAGNKTKSVLWSAIKAIFAALYVPLTRTVNNKALSNNISLNASDVGADASGTASTAVSNHNSSSTAHSAQFGNKQDNITVSGMLKGTGESVVAAQAGADYASPAISRTATLGVAAWTGAEAPFQQTVSVSGATANNPKVISPAYASIAEYAACGVKAAAEGAGTITFACDVAPENDLIVNILIVG